MNYENKATKQELIGILYEMSRDSSISFIYRCAAREARNLIIDSTTEMQTEESNT